MTVEELLPWAGAFGALAATANIVWTWMSYGSRANASQISELNAAHTELEIRLGKVESAVQHLPDRDITHRLETAIVELKGQMQLTDERLKPVAEMARMVHTRMFEEAGR